MSNITTYAVKHISVSINVAAETVYAFASDPVNLPQWASGLSTEIIRQGDSWIAESPMGTVKVRFAPKNSFGILDHDVTLPDGTVVYNPMRVIRNGTGCEVTFSLYHLPDHSTEQFVADASMVEKDLRALKDLLEQDGKII